MRLRRKTGRKKGRHFARHGKGRAQRCAAYAAVHEEARGTGQVNERTIHPAMRLCVCACLQACRRPDACPKNAPRSDARGRGRRESELATPARNDALDEFRHMRGIHQEEFPRGLAVGK